MIFRSLLSRIYRSRTAEVVVTELAVRLMSRRRSPRERATSVAILFPTDRGSVGDEAMVVALAERLREAGATRLGLISFTAGDKWSDLTVFDEVRSRPTGWPLRWFGFCRWLSQYDALGVIGADVLDGYYSPSRSRARIYLAQVAHRLGLRAVLLGFSYRQDPEQSALRILQKCKNRITVLCRDPRSLERVKRLAGAPAIQVADLAFLLRPAETSARVRQLGEWIGARKAEGGVILGINCNRQAVGTQNSDDPGDLIHAYVAAMANLAATHRNVAFVLVPHDSRGEFSDERLARRIYDKVDGVLKERCRLIAEVWTAAEIKAVAGMLDAAITGRMHFAIACLGSGVPVASFEYQDKFSGLYELFELQDLCVPGARSSRSDVVEALLNSMYLRVDTLRLQVNAKLPEIKRLSMRNVRALLGEPLD